MPLNIQLKQKKIDQHNTSGRGIYVLQSCQVLPFNSTEKEQLRRCIISLKFLSKIIVWFTKYMSDKQK